MKDIQLEIPPQSKQISSANHIGKQHSNDKSHMSGDGMLLSIVQMQQKMFEQKVLALIGEKFASLQNDMLSNFAGLDERVSQLENKMSSLMLAQQTRMEAQNQKDQVNNDDA